MNQLSSIFLTHVDLLDDLEEFKICTGYSVQSAADSGEPVHIEGRMPATITEFGEWKAIYKSLPGWQQETNHAITFGSLPDDLQSFVRLVEQQAKHEVVFVSTSHQMEEGMIRVRHGG